MDIHPNLLILRRKPYHGTKRDQLKISIDYERTVYGRQLPHESEDATKPLFSVAFLAVYEFDLRRCLGIQRDMLTTLLKVGLCSVSKNRAKCLIYFIAAVRLQTIWRLGNDE